jgi:thiol-disulfide isomerase/thioredoxin
MRSPSWLSARLLAVLLTLLLPGSASHADTSGEEQLFRAIANPDSAQWAVNELRRMLAAGEVAPNEVGIARNLITQALITSKAPAADVVASADSADALLGHDPGDRAQIQAAVGDYLETRGDAAGAEARYRMALGAVAGHPRYGFVRAMARNEIARYEMQRGASAQALTTLDSALADLPKDNINLRQKVDARIGDVQMKNGNVDLAIDAYVRSVGTFLGQDTSAAPALRSTWTKKNGSLAGLDARLHTAREASKQVIVFDARRFEQPAPRWTLNDLTGKPVSLAAHKGKVVVLDFWGSWCGPCRLELPHLQKSYEHYRTKGVAFTTVNVEMVDTPAEHKKVASAFMKANGYTFPVAIDPEGIAVQAHGVESYPTVYVIDKTGRIRFRNLGYTDGIGEIMAAQIDKLLAEK